MVSWLKEESMEDVLWIKPDTKGYKMASSGRQHSLILMDVGTEYTGAYTCIATNSAGQSICTAHLEVDESKESEDIKAPYIKIIYIKLFLGLIVTVYVFSPSPQHHNQRKRPKHQSKFFFEIWVSVCVIYSTFWIYANIFQKFCILFSSGFLILQLVLQKGRPEEDMVRFFKIYILSIFTVIQIICRN